MGLLTTSVVLFRQGIPEPIWTSVSNTKMPKTTVGTIMSSTFIFQRVRLRIRKEITHENIQLIKLKTLALIHNFTFKLICKFFEFMSSKPM